MERKLCHHCARSPITRPRQLCARCYYTGGVRELYPAVPPQESGRRGGSKNVGKVRTPEMRERQRRSILAWLARNR